MPRLRLTAQHIESLPAKDGKRTEYSDALLPGFVLRVSPSGARSYAVAAWSGGKKRRINLGPTKRLSLAKARDQAREVLEQLGAGKEPISPAAAGSLTVGQLVARCLADLALRPTTRKEWERLLKVEIAPSLGQQRATHLRRGQVREWMREIRTRSGWTATHAFEVLRRAYSWGIREDLLEASPLQGLERPFQGEASERVLSAEELWAVLRCLDRGQRLHGLYADATRLLLLTGVRRAAVLGMRREELEDVDGRDPRWVVPGGLGGRSKSGRAHVVPLSRAALVVVRRRLEATSLSHLFPRGLWRKVEKPATWPAQWRDWLRRRVQRTLDAQRRRQELPPRPVPRWTIHGFRHTVATHLREDLHVAPDVVSLVLGHTLPGPRASRIYDRAEKLPERRQALEAWADWLERLEAPAVGRKVLPIRPRRPL